MSRYDTIWVFRTKRFAVSLAWAYEDSPDISWDDTGEVAAKIESGEWTNAMFRVRVELDGIVIGEDYLGNSIYADVREFRDHIGSRGGYGSYFVDMVHEAIAEARKNICSAPRVRCA